MSSAECTYYIIKRAKNMGLYVVGIDPCIDAACKNEVDVFEVVGALDKVTRRLFNSVVNLGRFATASVTFL